MKNSINQKSDKQLKIKILLFLFYTCLIFIISHQRTLSSVTTFTYEDKFKHFAEYFVYSLITISFLKAFTTKHFLNTVIFCSIFAVSDELHQGFVGFFETGIFSGIRDCSFADWVADFLGILAGVFFYSKCNLRYRQKYLGNHL